MHSLTTGSILFLLIFLLHCSMFSAFRRKTLLTIPTAVLGISMSPTALRLGSTGSCEEAINYGPKSLEGCNMMIFGGSSGIGLATAKEATRQGAASIYIIGRNEEKLAAAKKEIEAIERKATASDVKVNTASVDVTDESKVRAFMETIPDDSIDHLVTTPGNSMKLGNLVANKRSCEDVKKQLDMKYFAQLAPVLAATDKMKRHGSITMTSGVLSRRTGRGNDALAISNAAIEISVRCLANDYGFDGKQVRVNCLSPGMTLTGVYGDSDWAKDYQARSAKAVPLQRNGLPEEMAHTIIFLQTNTFITGATIDCDGGNIIKP